MDAQLRTLDLLSRLGDLPLWYLHDLTRIIDAEEGRYYTGGHYRKYGKAEQIAAIRRAFDQGTSPGKLNTFLNRVENYLTWGPKKKT